MRIIIFGKILLMADCQNGSTAIQIKLVLLSNWWVPMGPAWLYWFSRIYLVCGKKWLYQGV
jgi:hypothetical protein